MLRFFLVITLSLFSLSGWSLNKNSLIENCIKQIASNLQEEYDSLLVYTFTPDYFLILTNEEVYEKDSLLGVKMYIGRLGDNNVLSIQELDNKANSYNFTKGVFQKCSSLTNNYSNNIDHSSFYLAFIENGLVKFIHSQFYVPTDGDPFFAQFDYSVFCIIRDLLITDEKLKSWERRNQ